MSTAIRRAIMLACVTWTCSPGGAVVAETTQTSTLSYAGWYLERGNQRLFQACGQDRSLLLTSAGGLHRRARAFGLDQDMPVYVRIRGRPKGDSIKVVSVLQFGSETPVRDCALSGVVKPPPA